MVGFIKKYKWPLIGVAAIGAFVLLKKKSSGSGGSSKITVQPDWAKVGANELVTAKTYSVGQRKAGMTYVSAQRTSGGLQFKSPVAGYFTRIVVNEGGKTLAEVYPS